MSFVVQVLHSDAREVKMQQMHTVFVVLAWARRNGVPMHAASTLCVPSPPKSPIQRTAPRSDQQWPQQQVRLMAHLIPAREDHLLWHNVHASREALGEASLRLMAQLRALEPPAQPIRAAQRAEARVAAGVDLVDALEADLTIRCTWTRTRWSCLSPWRRAISKLLKKDRRRWLIVNHCVDMWREKNENHVSLPTQTVAMGLGGDPASRTMSVQRILFSAWLSFLLVKIGMVYILDGANTSYIYESGLDTD
jgi:hypothetical protein